MSSSEEINLLSAHREEKKELQAKIQKMKHSVSKANKKNKKEVNTEIAKLVSELEIKQENELKDLKNKKENLAKEKEKFIKDQEEEMTQLSEARIQELNLLNEKLKSRNLLIHEIPSDGDCLYRAIQHQLSLLNIQKVMSVALLRKLTAEHLLSNKDEYIPFLTNPFSGEIMSEDELKNYCDQVVNHHAWGGHVEVQVLSRICGFPIEVIQAYGPSVIAGDENLNPKLLLSYHRHAYNLGEHYNSLVPAI